MERCTKIWKFVLILMLTVCSFTVRVYPGLVESAFQNNALRRHYEQAEVDMVRFDAIIELNAPLCRTHVVQFVRYWISPQAYRMSIVWAEPHSGSFNFPIYPPTLNVASDKKAFRVEHQFKHLYDGTFPKPIEQRGPFLHKFNVYAFSDIRFAEQDALDLRIHADDVKLLEMSGSEDKEQTSDVNVSSAGKLSAQQLSRVSVRATKGRFDELRLIDPNGELLKGIKYEYADIEGKARLVRQNVLLPERPITIGFKGKKPTITINDEKRQISELETTHHAGGRKCTVDYRQFEFGGRMVTLPVRVIVRNGDSKKLLRSARLYNFTHCKLSPDQLKQAAERFSHFTDSEMKCREMLVKYWVKEPADVDKDNVEILEQLREHFSGKSTDGLTIGEQLRHANVLLQLDWMLGRNASLESDFREYLSLLADGNLDRMMLIGGQNAIELTIRWGQLDVADKLLDIWVKTAVPRNKAEVTLKFGGESLRRKRYWTSARLMDKLLETSRLTPAQRFVASAIRSIGRARVCEMIKHPDRIRKEFDIVQAGWVSYHMNTETLERDLRQNILEAKESYTELDRPTRDHKALRAQLEKIAPKTQNVEDL